MRKERTYYKVYDTELKEYPYYCDQYRFFELEFKTIKEVRNYSYGRFKDKTRYEIHKFTEVISSDCVNCDPPTKEDFIIKDMEQLKKDDYNRRMKEYVDKFSPRDKIEEEQLELQFAQYEAMKELQNAIKKANESMCKKLEKEIEENYRNLLTNSNNDDKIK